MEKRSISQSVSGRYRPFINTGGRGMWCMFDYEVEPAPNVLIPEIVIGENVTDATIEWFPHVKRGIEQGLLVLKESYEIELVEIRIRIANIVAHSVDTTVRACERFGSDFIDSFGRALDPRVHTTD